MKKYTLIFALLCSLSGFAQVKIGSLGTPDANAVLELDGGTTKGFLLPRITTTDMNGGGFSAAPNGLLIYNSTDGFLYIRKAGAWQKVTDATNNGTFTLPYSGTASTVGGAEFSITHTTTFGDAAAFNNTAGGVAISTVNGTNKFNTTTGNTGIGIPAGLSDNPTLGRLVVRGTIGSTSAVFGDKTTGVSIENNSPGIGFNTYTNSGSKTIADGFAARISHNSATGLWSFINSTGSGTAGNANDAAMLTRMVINAAGNVGIGEINPAAMQLHVKTIDSALMQLENSTTTGSNIKTGLFFKTGNNYSGSIATVGAGATYRMGLFTYGGSTPGSLIERLSISDGGFVGIGNTDPTVPLNFAATVGNKISLFGDGTGGHYGLGIQGALMQLYTNGSSADIAFGYGRSGSFTEKYRFGNSGYMNIQNGRLRFTGQLGAGNSQGIEFTNFAGTAVKGFFGQYDENNMGFYGYAGAGWAMLFNQATGQLNIGATRNANDVSYKLNVGGKILAEEVRVTLQASWPDYVFAKDYKLPTLENLEAYIANNSHLPNVPAAAEVEKSGLAIGEMQTKMMEKIEELSLYILQLNKQLKDQQVQIDGLKKRK